jgi:hypothetical protein
VAQWEYVQGFYWLQKYFLEWADWTGFTWLGYKTICGSELDWIEFLCKDGTRLVDILRACALGSDSIEAFV